MTVRGLTIIELLVALAISGLVALGVHAAVNVATGVATRSGDVAGRTMAVEAARRTIRLWLEGAHLTEGGTGRGFRGKDVTDAGHDHDELSFLTLNPGPISDAPGVPHRIVLEVMPDSGLVARYFPRHGGPAGLLRLLPEVRGMDIRYRIRLGSEVRWLRSWSSRVRLPEAVRVEFQSAAGSDALVGTPMLIALPRQG